MKIKKILFTCLVYLSFFSIVHAQNYEENLLLFKVEDKSILPTEINTGSLKSYQSNHIEIQNLLDAHGIAEIKPLISNSFGIKHPNITELKKIYVMECSDCVPTALLTDLKALSQHFPKASLIPKMESDYTPNDYAGLSPNCTCPAPYNCFPDYLNQINAPAAWDITKGSPSIKIGIMDIEFNTNHEDLIGKIAHSSLLSECDPLDGSCGHGTYVAGLAAGNTDNGLGASSIGFNCMLELYEKEVSGGVSSFSDEAEKMLELISRNIKILNMSWGFCSPGAMGVEETDPIIEDHEGLPEEEDPTGPIEEEEDLFFDTFHDMFKMAYDFGITMVATAGNGSFGCAGGPPLSGSLGNGYRYPASFDEVISVTSVNTADQYEGENPSSGYISHSHNDKVDIAAPGFGNFGLGIGSSSYGCHTGTSAAAPVVSGLIGLMLSVNPSLQPEDIRYILRCTAVDISGIVNNDGTPNSEYYDLHQAGRIDAFAAVQMAQTYHSTNSSMPTSAGVTTWENLPPIQLDGDVILEAGDVLILRSLTALMHNESRIVVRRGAKLILDDAALTNCFAGQIWGGITVEGYADVEHNNLDLALIESENPLPSSYPGVVLLKNDSRIENVGNGAIATKRMIYNNSSGNYEDMGSSYYGGIVIAENSTFRNNRRAVEFLNYDYENISRFTNCVFEKTNIDQDWYWRGVTMYGVKGVVFDACTFDSAREELYCSSIGADVSNTVNELSDYIGIGTLNASYDVINGCSFSNLTIGVWAIGSYSNFNAINIGSNTGGSNYFNDNCQAIWLQGISGNSPEQLSIQNNVLDNNQLGIFAFECTSYIEDNSISNSDVGIAFYNNKGYYIQANCNYFDNCDKGIQYIGENRNCFFKNNIFDESQIADVYINHIPAQDGVSEILGQTNYQNGSSQTPFLNAFSESDAHSIYTEIDDVGNYKTMHFDYYHFDPSISDRIVPDCDLNSTCDAPMNFINKQAYDNFDDAEDYTGCIDLEELSPAPSPPGVEVPVVCDTRICLNDIRFDIMTSSLPLLEGNSNDLLNALNTTPNASATHEAFTQSSPYVADDLLRKIAENSDMAQWIKEDILIQNAPLSDEMMLIAQDQVSDYGYQVLYTIKYYDEESDRDALRRYLCGKEKERLEGLDFVLREAVSAEDDSEIVAILEEESDLTAKQQLSGYYLENGETGTALDVANDFTTPDYQDIQNINISIVNGGKAEYVFSAEEEMTLMAIANDFSQSAAHARSLLEWFKGERLPFPELAEYAAGKNQERKKYKVVPLLTNWQSGKLSLSPNPAKEKIQVYLPNTDFKEISIYNTAGHQVQSISLDQNERIIEIPLWDLKDGIYYLVATGEKQQLHSKLLIL